MGPLVLISLSQHFLLFLHTWLVRDVYVLFSWRGLCTYLPYLVNLWGGSHLITVEFVCMVFFRVFISMSSCCVHRGRLIVCLWLLMLWIGCLMSLYDIFELEW